MMTVCYTYGEIEGEYEILVESSKEAMRICASDLFGIEKVNFMVGETSRTLIGYADNLT